MLFPSFTFILAFLPLTLLLYYILAKRSRPFARLWLIAASFVFYSWFNWSYSLILAGSILGNWFFASLLYRNRSKLILSAGIIGNILLLGYFKYYDFFIGNINVLFGSSFLLKNILLPLGISFFTFQQISFLRSVYSGTLETKYTFGSYALFVCFFPQLIAGPIVLPDEMMSQFEKPENTKPDPRNIAAGLYIFALGLGKKILLADFFAEIADSGFAAAGGEFFSSWQTALAYTFQIYFDFSGYCDMAIGIGLLFNIRLPKNFDSPYCSASITEFWKRWHITLGRFLQNEIYIPLGGSRVSKTRTCINLFLTFLISGIWHGASWLFVFWGLLHGAAMILHRIWSKFLGWKMHWIAARILTFLFVLTAWVPFRSESFSQMNTLYRGMFLPDTWNFPAFSWKNLFLFLSGCFIVLFLKPASDMEKRFRPTWSNAILTIVLIVVSMFFFVKTSPFIYFNF